MSTVASAPNLRASCSRGFSGAPTAITLPAPISWAAATARIPIGPEPWMTTVSPQVKPPARVGAIEGADAGGQGLRQCAEPQRHVVRQFVDFRARQHVEIDIDVFRPSAPQMRRLVEPEVAAVIDRASGTCWHLRIVDAVIAASARHQRRDHHFRSHASGFSMKSVLNSLPTSTSTPPSSWPSVNGQGSCFGQ